MKNLLIYINPSRTFFDPNQKAFRDCRVLARLQIDNSLSLGWKKEDILLVTNFEFNYNGVSSLVISDESFCPFRPLSTKTTTVSYLLENGILDKEELYWAHDFDAYQDFVINESELELENFDVGLTDYGWSQKWCLGSYFFKTSAQDIFKAIQETIYKIQNEDERALSQLSQNNTNNINERIKRLNITYNFGMRHIGHNYRNAIKPLKVLHFHPAYPAETKLPHRPLNCFMYGKNEINKPLMSKRLIKIFQQHGIK